MTEDTSGTVESVVELQCPVCSSRSFLAFNGRQNARCEKCRTMERTRLLWMVLERFEIFKMGQRVLHVAPELAFAKRFADLSGDRYHACDIDPDRYKSRFTTVRPLDLCSDLVKLPSRSFDLIIHSHVLEHVACDVEGVLREFERILAPGGHHFFSVPVRGDVTRENLSDDLTPDQRKMLFGQEDHCRLFGAVSLREMLSRVWKIEDDPAIDPLDLFTQEELRRAAIPVVAWSGYSGHTIFHRHRPSRMRLENTDPIAQVGIGPTLTSANLPSDAAAPPSNTHSSARTRLILHIGTPKTGTTSIQRWMSSNRDALSDLGLDYWAAAENHSERLFLAFAAPQRVARKSMWFQRGGGPSQQGSSNPLGEFEEFLNALDGRTGFVSAEALWTFTRTEIEGLQKWLAERGVETEVICWVREPAEYLTSTIQQKCRSDLSLADLSIRPERVAPVNNARLDDWGAIFGEESVNVLAYSKDVLADLRNFLQQKGVATLPSVSGDESVNPSISLTAAKALMALNGWERRHATEGKSRPRRARALQSLLLHLEGEKFALPESTARQLSDVMSRERAYLKGKLGHLPAGSGATDAVDDHAMINWQSDEIGHLLSAINDLLLQWEAKVRDR